MRDVGVSLNLKPKAEIMAEVRAGISKGISDALTILEADAKSLATYDPQSRHASGDSSFPHIHNRDSIKAFQKWKNNKLKCGLVTTSGRGAWIELGSGFGGPHPYLKPALDKNSSRFMSKLKDVV